MDGDAERALRALRRESVAHALHTWRLADAVLRHRFLADERPVYERRVAAVAEDLRRFRTVAALVSHYAAERLARHSTVVAACTGRDAEPGAVAVVIECAAFWRRLRELVAEAVA